MWLAGFRMSKTKAKYTIAYTKTYGEISKNGGVSDWGWQTSNYQIETVVDFA